MGDETKDKLQTFKGEEKRKAIGYFSMEVGLKDNIPTYSGGLGILAGDTLKACADNKIPLVGITLLNEKGYFHQRINEEGYQYEEPVSWSVDDFMIKLDNEVTVKIEGREVKIRAWEHKIIGETGFIVPVLFLDTNIDGNNDYDRKLTSHLYGGDERYRLNQEIILGIGGVRMLRELGYMVEKYHMNEGHAAFLTTELLREKSIETNNQNFHDPKLLKEIRELCSFTTHTPVAAGHDAFEHGLLLNSLGDFIPQEIIKVCSDYNKFSMTRLALYLSKAVNAVSREHAKVSRAMFPHYDIDYITNGIHAKTWVNDSLAMVFDKYLPYWKEDSTELRNALMIPNSEIERAHRKSKEKLLDFVNSHTNIGFDYDHFTIGFARRATPYKRAELLLRDMERLKQMASKYGPIQIIYAGKAHPHDGAGKEIIKHIIDLSKSLNGLVKIAFLRNYSMSIGRLITSGVDVWLNTPIRPLEASGTSGMKAAVNGVPSLSILDGWWMEGCVEDITGWAIGPMPSGTTAETNDEEDSKDLYNKLENKILPLFKDKDKWTLLMKNSIAINGAYFNTHRMSLQYVNKAYFV